ncbi:deoxynucleoside kinase, partial [Oenococcus oeni]
LSRIEKRGRDFEQISVHPDLYKYYQELNRRYAVWYAAYDRGPKMEIDGDKYDFVESKDAAQEVLNQIDERLFDLGILVG